jgi:hypothetical protein
METVNTVVSSASKMIWGEPKAGEEPVNGQTGAGTLNEPYDKGNDDVAGTAPSTTSPTSTGTTAKSDINPASSGAAPFQKQQGADRPTEEPSAAQTEAVNDKTQSAEHASSSHPHITSDEQREKLAEKGELPKIPNDHSGEPMKMHAGGDPEKPVEGETTAQKTERSASVAQEGGGEHGKVKGTGEQWVKTSGMAAEGGDFDVTKPGAGKEATRLMEEKGIKTEGTKIDPDAPKETSPGPSGEKVSKIAKLKDKLHIGTGKHI